MPRAIAIVILAAAFSAVAAADELTLSDGRTFTGIVRVEGDSVLIQLPNATLSFPLKDVRQIEKKPTPEEDFAERLAKTSATDPAAVFALAQWASSIGLNRQARDLCAKVIQLDGDHAEARKLLGFVKVDGQWQPFEKAVEITRGKLQAGQFESVLKDIVPALEGISTAKDRQAIVREVQAQAQVRSRDFAGAAKTFAALAEVSEGPAAVRAATTAEILEENADGMYVLSEPYPTTAAIMDPDKAALKAGPASLADPMVLQAALRDRAKKEIETGRKLMDSAQEAEATDPEAAKVNYAKAGQFLDRADAMSDGIARSYHVEIARRRITAMRRDADADADRFDKAMAKLGGRNLSVQEYQTMVLNLVQLLDNVRDNLQAIMTVAKPYPRDLVLELKWAELDLRKIEAMRKVLLDEINGQNKAVLISCVLACLAAVYGSASNGLVGDSSLQQALDSLSKGDYTSAQRQGRTLASRPGAPDGRGWLIAASACQQQKDYPAAIDAYNKFLATNTSASTRRFVTSQIASCQSAQKGPQVVVPPSKFLTQDDLAALSKVEATTTTESSEHFVVKARNAKLAKLLVHECETALTRICGDILAGQEFPHRVEVNVWTDEKDFHANVGGEPEWAGGSFSIAKVGGLIVRRIDLAQLDAGGRFAVTMLDRVLPHELCHLVTGEFFGDSPAPLFLNEGLAMLAESQTDVQRTLLAGSAVAGKEKIPLDDLLVRQISGKGDVTIFYAESQSFTEFLRARLSDGQFRDFLEHLKSGCTVADALQRALYVSESDSFMPALAAAWEDHAIQQGQLVRALRGGGLTMLGK